MTAQYQSFPGADGDSHTLDKLKALKLPSLTEKSFLDVGCNEGFFCGFAHYLGASRVVGLDHSADFIARARARFPQCEFLARGWDRLPEEKFDVILLASALHYADDQPALIQRLVEQLTERGVLVLEMGIVPSKLPEWRQVQRGIDTRLFPSMPMMRQVLKDYAWKWLGTSVTQGGDPVPRHVFHISRRRPVAYLLMQPPGYGKSSLAKRLFGKAKVPVVAGDRRLVDAARGRVPASAALRTALAEDLSLYQLDQAVVRAFERDLAADLVDVWLHDVAPGADIAVDAYVPQERHAEIQRLLDARGYLPVKLDWDRPGLAPIPAQELAHHAEAFYLSMAAGQGTAGDKPNRNWQPAGFVDEAEFIDGHLVVRGWAVDAAGFLPEGLAVKLGRKQYPAQRLEKQLRPDVQRYLELPHALVGFRARVAIPGVKTAEDLQAGYEVVTPAGLTLNFTSGDAKSSFHPQG
ncbi:MAG: methyltransferase domain-containing protein [Pseudoxanthomonas sp.]